jgi:methyl-accepting chemotaxis protein
MVEQISANIREISAAGKSSTELAEKSKLDTEAGQAAIEQATAQMKKIEAESGFLQTAMAKLAQGSKEISEIVDLIRSIASQTNLLALNAAIEAARAGEHGRGFAVVAEEVRKLAAGAGEAAERITVLIKRNEEDMADAIQASESSSAGVQMGISVVEDAGTTFKRIATSVVELSGQILDITKSLEQITVGSGQLVQSVQSVDDISRSNISETQAVSAATEQQAASMQEIASSCETLAEVAEELQALAEKFRV